MRRKIYYSIGEVAQHVELEQHVLRFWETEFAELKPEKNRAGNRVYRERDIELVEKIKFLLYEEQFTIEGARKRLKSLRKMPLQEYKRAQLLLQDVEFIKQLKQLLGD